MELKCWQWWWQWWWSSSWRGKGRWCWYQSFPICSAGDNLQFSLDFTLPNIYSAQFSTSYWFSSNGAVGLLFPLQQSSICILYFVFLYFVFFCTGSIVPSPSIWILDLFRIKVAGGEWKVTKVPDFKFAENQTIDLCAKIHMTSHQPFKIQSFQGSFIL